MAGETMDYWLRLSNDAVSSRRYEFNGGGRNPQHEYLTLPYYYYYAFTIGEPMNTPSSLDKLSLRGCLTLSSERTATLPC